MKPISQDVKESITDVIGPCFIYPLPEVCAEGIHGIRIFFDRNKSLIIDYFDPEDNGCVNEVLGFELSLGIQEHHDEHGDILVSFPDPKPLSLILPFLRDWLAGRIPDPSGLYLNQS